MGFAQLCPSAQNLGFVDPLAGEFGSGREGTESLAWGSQQNERGDLCDVALCMCLMISGYMMCFKSSYIELYKVKENKTCSSAVPFGNVKLFLHNFAIPDVLCPVLSSPCHHLASSQSDHDFDVSN